MPNDTPKSFFRTYLHSVWIPPFLFVVCSFIPRMVTSFLMQIFAREENPTAFLNTVVSAAMFAGYLPVVTAALGILIAGIYQVTHGMWLKGLVNLVLSVILGALFVILPLLDFTHPPRMWTG